MRGIAVSDDAGGCGARLRSLRVDVLDLRHEAIRVGADMRQVFPGEIGDLGKGGDAVFVAAADGLLQPDPHHAGANLAAAGEESFIDEAGIGRQAGRRQRDLNGHILAAAQQVEHSHVLARLPLVVPIAAELVENAVRTGAAGLTVVVEEAQANRQDIFDYANRSTVSEDYKAFIEEFLKGVKE